MPFDINSAVEADLSPSFDPTSSKDLGAFDFEASKSLNERGLWEQTKYFIAEQAKAVVRGVKSIPAYPQSMAQIAFDQVRNSAKKTTY